MKDKVSKIKKDVKAMYSEDVKPHINKFLKITIWTCLSVIGMTLLITESIWDAQFAHGLGGSGREALAAFGIAFVVIGFLALLIAFYYGKLRNWKFGKTVTALLFSAAVLFIIAASVSAKYQRDEWHKFTPRTNVHGDALKFYRAQQIYPAIVVILSVFAPVAGVAAIWYAYRNGAVHKVINEHKSDYLANHVEEIKAKEERDRAFRDDK